MTLLSGLSSPPLPSVNSAGLPGRLAGAPDPNANGESPPPTAPNGDGAALPAPPNENDEAGVPFEGAAKAKGLTGPGAAVVPKLKGLAAAEAGKPVAAGEGNPFAAAEGKPLEVDGVPKLNAGAEVGAPKPKIGTAGDCCAGEGEGEAKEGKETAGGGALW